MTLSPDALVAQLDASNAMLRIIMSSDLVYHQRRRAWEQLGRNLRTMGVDSAVVWAIPEPQSHYRPPVAPRQPSTPSRYLTTEEVLMPNFGF